VADLRAAHIVYSVKNFLSIKQRRRDDVGRRPRPAEVSSETLAGEALGGELGWFGVSV
jgi:hypothetical protein